MIQSRFPSDPVATTTTNQPASTTSVATAAISLNSPMVAITETKEVNDTNLSPQSIDATETSTLPSSNHTNDSFTSVREAIAWTLAATSTVLFIGSLTVNITVLWVYKKRQAKDNNVESRAYEMEGNPCYEASNDINYVKQMADTQEQEIHVYERVRQNKPK